MFLFCSQLPSKSIGMSQGPKRYQYLRLSRLLAITHRLRFMPAVIPQTLMDFPAWNVTPWELIGTVGNAQCGRFFFREERIRRC